MATILFLRDIKIQVLSQMIREGKILKDRINLLAFLQKIQAIEEKHLDQLIAKLLDLKECQLLFIERKLSFSLMRVMKKKGSQYGESIPRILKCIQIKLSEFSHHCLYLNLHYCLKSFLQSGKKLPTTILVPEKAQQNIFQTRIPSKIISFRALNKIDSSLQLNTHLKQIANGRIKLPDLSCIGCISRIYEGCRVTDDVSSSNVIYLDGGRNREGLELQKHTCALLNSGGGYLICGADPQTHQAEGQIVSEKAKAKYGELLEAAVEEISPKQFSFKLDFVPVLPSPFVQKQPEKGKYLTRISFELQSRRPGEIFYSKMEKKGAQTIFEVYVKEGNRAKQLQGEKIYMAFQSLPSRKRFKKKDHQCEEPEFGIPLDNQEGELLGEEKGEKVERIQPKYRNSSLLSVGSPNKIANIHNFQKLLKQNKVVYEMHQPFMKYQPKNGRQTFFLSYEDKCENLDILRNMLHSYSLNLQKVTLKLSMKTALNPINENEFKGLFKKVFCIQSNNPYEFTYSVKKNGKYQQPLFSFRNLQESVFGFIGFHFIGIRCFFSH